LQITYKSDQPLVLSLIQPGILADSGACYGISLGVSNTLTTITAPISQFLQPDWSDLTAIPLQLDSVKYVSISPNVDPTNNAVSGTIVVSELLLCNVSPITGIKNISGTKSRIKVYPNPAENVVYIESNNLLNARIDIMNISGATVISKESINSNIEQIDVSGLSRGMYFIRITNSDNSVTQKLMIK